MEKQENFEQKIDIEKNKVPKEYKSCRLNFLRNRENNDSEEIRGFLAYFKDKREWHKEVIKDSLNVIAVEKLVRYANEDFYEDNGSIKRRDSHTQKEIASTLFSFVSEVSEEMQKEISGFSRDSSSDSLEAANFLSSFLDLAINNDTEGQGMALLKTIETIKILTSKLPEISLMPSKIFFKKINGLSLRIGEEETVQKFIDEFTKDTDFKFFNEGTFSYLFPVNDRNSSSSKDLNKLYEERKSQVEDLTEKNEILKQYTEANDVLNGHLRSRITGEILERFNVDASIHATWGESDLLMNQGNWYLSNLVKIRRLEKRQEGSVKKLSENNGIFCFARYDEEILLEQLKPILENEPYGIMGTSYQDHNGVFTNKAETFKKVRHGAIDSGMRTRIFEYDALSQKDFFYTIQNVASVDGDGEKIHKARWVWINQHGRPTRENEEIKEKIQNEWEHRLGIGENRESLILEDGGAVALMMCYGGEEGNVANVLAKEYDISSAGPSISITDVSNVSFYEDRETKKLSIDVDYEYPEDDPDLPRAKTMKYKHSES